MKRWFLLTCIFISLFSFKTNVLACSDKTLLNEANKVTISLSENKETNNLYSIIKIDNLTDNLYIEVYEDRKESKTLYYGTDNKEVTINETFLYQKINYVVRVYSNNGNCSDEILKTLKVTTNRYNSYARSNFCEIEENKKEYICDPFYDTTDIDEDEFKKITEEIEYNRVFSNRAKTFIKKYGLYIFIPFLVLSLIYTLLIFITKKKKSLRIGVFILSIMLLIPFTQVNAEEKDNTIRTIVPGQKTDNYSYIYVKVNYGLGAVDMPVGDRIIYDTLTGEEIYCLQPPLNFGQVVVDKQSTDFGTVIEEAEKRGADYYSTLVAIRLYAAATGYSKFKDGWYGWSASKQANVSSTASIYKNTVNAINGGYDGKTFKGENILYQKSDDGNNFKQITDAFEIYKAAMNASDSDEDGSDSSDVKITVDDNNVVWDESGKSKVTIRFSKKINISSITSSTSNISVSYDANNLYACDDGYCLDVELSIKKIEECQSINFNLTIKFEGDSSASACVYTTSNGSLQEFVASCDSTENSKIINLKSSNLSACPTKTKTDLSSNCEESTTGKIEDPQFCAVIEDEASCKAGDSNFLFITDSNKYCKVYIREIYEYEFMPKIQAVSGRYFVYDVKSKASNNNHKWLSIITTKREVLSSNIKVETFKKDLDEANKKIRSAYTEWQKWKALAELGGYTSTTSETQTCPGRGGSCCDGYYKYYDDGGTRFICTLRDTVSNFGRCSEKLTLYEYTWKAKYPNDKGQRLDAVETRKDTGTLNCPGACSSSPCSSEKEEVDLAEVQAYFESNEASSRKKYETAISYRDSLITDIENCNLVAGSSYYNQLPKENEFNGEYNLSFDFDLASGSSDNYNSNYEKFVDVQREKIDNSKITFTYDKKEVPDEELYKAYCPGTGDAACEYDISKDINSSSASCWVAKVECGDNGCTDIMIDVPCNTAVLYTITEDYGYYQDAKLATNMYYGEIELRDGISGENKNNWINLDDYSFPIDVNATDITVNVSYTIKGQRKSFKTSKGEYICSVDLCNETTNYAGQACPCTRNCICDTPAGVERVGNSCCKKVGMTLICNDSGTESDTLGFYFRAVDLNNLFPNERPAGKNWQGSKEIIEKIETLGDDIWVENKGINGVESQYTVELTAENRKKITEYNKTKISSVYNGGYMDNSLVCNSNYVCESEFLKLLANGSVNGYAKSYKKVYVTDNIYNYDPSRHSTIIEGDE